MKTRILTHFAPHCEESPWLAIEMNTACRVLDCYDLTEEQKTNIGAIMAAYCNILDRSGLLAYGMTENEAVAKAKELAKELHELNPKWR